jgi:hypothetical protein
MQVNIQYGSKFEHRYKGSFIFVVSHMRSFSSLLCHILGSHPQISGYAEAQQSYLGRPDLDRLARMVGQLTGDPALRPYVLDKILHNERQIMSRVLDRPDVKVVFLLRNAEDTLTSMLNIAHALDPEGRYADPERALEYYATRLQQLQHYASELGPRALFVESERLVDDTETVLDALSAWLLLDPRLSAEYKTFPFTGKYGYGDPSPNISRGTIVKDVGERHRDYVEIRIPDDVLERANAAYRACREALARSAGVRA